MKKVLFIDRDGTMILETDDFKIETMEKIIFYPEVFYWLGRIVREFDFELVLVTNQDGLGSDAFPHEPFYSTHRFIMNTFAGERIFFAEECIDPHYPHENKDTRKPGTGMLKKYINNPEYDLKNSFVIGDRITDVQLAKNLGARAFWLNDGRSLGGTEVQDSQETLSAYVAVESRKWEDIYNYLIENRTGIL